MALAWIWTIMVVFSIIYGLLSGNIDAVGAAALGGAKAAVDLGISICGVTCLWSGIMEIMRRGGTADKLSRLFRPVLNRLFPSTRHSAEVLEALSANVSANLLGLGNAATPLGIRAATAMTKLSAAGIASNDLCLLVVINSSSLQLIPATVAAVRSANGAQTPFDILPAVWITSIAAVVSGIFAAKLLEKLFPAGKLHE